MAECEEERVCRGTSWVAARVWRTLWKFQMLDVISLETPQRKWASSRLEGKTSWIFSSCGRCSGLTKGTLGTRSGFLRKGQSPCELLGGLTGFHAQRTRVPGTLSAVWFSCVPFLLGSVVYSNQTTLNKQTKKRLARTSMCRKSSFLPKLPSLPWSQYLGKIL